MAMLRLIRRVCRDQKGSGTAELVIVMPVLFLLFLSIVQFALYMHAAHIAQAAAAQALSAARVSGGSAGAGTAAGQQVLAQLGRGPLREPSVRAQRGADQASAQVRGKAVSVIPFVTLAVRAEAVGPVEKFSSAVSP
ncbi:TadE/TadG family type IV pilus assembly protein [Lentzea rhizosphaerae]|uniref:TadE/TadG family type IV pilus assembly protein n=1 Tax=Lentzea rhizosphaerae TaxID=2041025 RepID=A0ABV8C7D2_9PSEU